MTKVTRYVYDGADVCAEYEDSDNDGDVDRTRVYWLLPGMDRRIGFAENVGGTNTFYYYLTDQVGTVLRIVKEDGTVVNQYDYDAFGRVRQASPNTFATVENRYLFQGREWDKNGGFYYFRNRIYLPERGEFASPDMNLGRGILGELDGMATLTFCGGDPVNCVDPTGLEERWWETTRKYWDGRITQSKDITNSDTHWLVAGTANSVMDIGGGFMAIPDVLARLGSGSGTFAGKTDAYIGNAVDVSLLDVGEAVPIIGGTGKNLGISCAGVAEKPSSVENWSRAVAATCQSILTVAAPYLARNGLKKESASEKPVAPTPKPVVKSTSSSAGAGSGAASGPGSIAHKVARWNQYQARGGQWSKERWDKVYDQNMSRATRANSASDDYHKSLGWGKREVTVNVEGVARRLDIGDEATMRACEVKTGYQSLTQENLWELLRDQVLREKGWDVMWRFEGKASGPLRNALDAAEIPYTGGL